MATDDADLLRNAGVADSRIPEYSEPQGSGWYEILTAVIAAAVVAVVLVVVVLLARWGSARSQRRFEAVVEQLDVHMEAISYNLQRAVERSDDARSRGLDDLGE